MFQGIEALRRAIPTKLSPKLSPREPSLVQTFELANIGILKDWGAIDLMGKLKQELRDTGDLSAHLTYVRGYPYCGLTLGWDLTEDSSVSTGWKSRQIELRSRPFPGECFEAKEDFLVRTSSSLPLSVKDGDRFLRGRVIVSLIGANGDLQSLERSELFLQHLRENFAGEMAKNGVDIERFAQETTLLRMPLEEQARLAMKFSGYSADSRYVASSQ